MAEKRYRHLLETAGIIGTMSQSDVPTTPVGQQLAARRDELDLTQDALARRIGITTTTVSATETGRTKISLGKRGAWETALRLKAGTIGRAYRTGAALEVQADDSDTYADMTDRYERAIWEMAISVEDRRTLIDLLRQDRRDRQQSA